MTPDEMRRRRIAIKDAEYRRRWNTAKHFGIPTSPVDAAPTRDRIKALIDLGWSTKALEDMTGHEISDSTMLLILNPDQATVHRATAEHIANIPLSVNVPDTVDASRLVPALGAHRRITGLFALGWRHTDLKARGVSAHNTIAGRYLQTQATKWRAIDVLFRELSMTLGPSATTRARAATLGFLPPLAWDDLDDPAETPKGRPSRNHTDPDSVDDTVVERILGGEWRLSCTRAEKEAVTAQWIDWGRPVSHLARNTGWKPERYYKKDAA